MNQYALSTILAVGIMYSGDSVSMAVAGATPTSDAYLWTLQFRKGDLVHSVTHASLSGKVQDQPLAAEIDQSSDSRVIAVSASGDATLQMAVQSSVTRFRGVAMKDVGSTVPVTSYSVTRHGIITRVPGNTNSDQAGSSAVFSMLLANPTPNNAVKIGETWRTSVRNRLVDNDRSVFTSTLKSVRKEGTVQLLEIHLHARLHSTASADPDEDIIIDGDYAVDPEAGFVTHSEYSVDNLPVSAGSQTLKLRVSTHVDNTLNPTGPNTAKSLNGGAK